MSSLSLSHAIGAGKTHHGFISGSDFHVRDEKQFSGNSFVSFRKFGNRFTPVYAKLKKKGKRKHNRPWPRSDEIEREWKSEHLIHLSEFKPLKEKPKPVILEFEQPLVDCRKKIDDVRRLEEETGLDFKDQIQLQEMEYLKLTLFTYSNLTPIQRVHIARHPNRPTFLDHVLNMTDKWIELHGDRAGYDDPAIVCGLGSMEGKTYMFIGHQKGRNSKENIKRNFGMPTPHGYRKALRFMKYADLQGFPIITFIDTPGAFADLKSEELNQGEAIANNLRSMFGLKVPIVSIVIGEGGSGGALAIGCANKLLMLQNAVFYVASPEACAAILYKSAEHAPRAAKKLRITANELHKLGICDAVIPEPLGGAHKNPKWTSNVIKKAVLFAMEKLSAMDTESMMTERMLKFRKIGAYREPDYIDPIKTRKMKKREAPVSVFSPSPPEVELKQLEKAIEDAKSELTGEEIKSLISDESITLLKQESNKEIAKAFASMGLKKRADALMKKIGGPISIMGKSTRDLSPELKKEVGAVMRAFKTRVARPETFLEMKEKLQLLSLAVNLRKSLGPDYLKNGEEEVSESGVGFGGETTVELQADDNHASNSKVLQIQETAAVEN